MYVYVYISIHVCVVVVVVYIYIYYYYYYYYTHTPRTGVSLLRSTLSGSRSVAPAQFGRYTILPSSILYGVWHTKGGSGGRRILRNSRARVFCNGVGNAGGGGMQGWLIRAQQPQSERISCKGQSAVHLRDRLSSAFPSSRRFGLSRGEVVVSRV